MLEILAFLSTFAVGIVGPIVAAIKFLPCDECGTCRACQQQQESA